MSNETESGRAAEQPALDWSAAKLHFDEVRKQYQDLEGNGVNTTMALRLIFDPLATRFNRGERTAELHSEMMAIE